MPGVERDKRKLQMSETLAIEGGRPVVDASEVQPWPILDDRDRQAVLRVFDSGYLCGAEAPEVTALENEWAAYIGRKHCLTTNSGTAALHMALAALNIGPGDEVLVPSYTFLASASCVLHAGAVPVFVDIDRNTCTIDPKKMEEKISPRTKAVIPVHIHGLTADMDGIMSVARKNNLHVVEDACQAWVHSALTARRTCAEEKGVCWLSTMKSTTCGQRC